jgi:hypothetical protein
MRSHDPTDSADIPTPDCALDEFTAEHLDGSASSGEGHRGPLRSVFDRVVAPTSLTTLGKRAWRAGSRTFRRPFSETALEDQEFNGLAVAILLAVGIIGYGVFLAAIWRTPTDARVTGTTTASPRRAGDSMTAVDVPVTGRSVVDTAVARTPPVAHTAAPPFEHSAAAIPTPRTLITLWQRRDTRSLDHAFTMLRQDTLAFHRCGMRMTGADQAVARCDGIATTLAADGTAASRSAIWNIEFQRTGGRWLIAHVTTR